MMYLEVSTNPRFVNGYLDEYKGHRAVRYCTRQYLRDTLRKLFEDKNKRYLAIHKKSTNTIYEGIKIDSWVTDEVKNIEVVGFTIQKIHHIDIEINDIMSLHILY